VPDGNVPADAVVPHAMECAHMAPTGGADGPLERGVDRMQSFRHALERRAHLHPARTVVFERPDASGGAPVTRILGTVIPHFAWLDDGKVLEFIAKLEDLDVTAEAARKPGREVEADP